MIGWRRHSCWQNWRHRGHSVTSANNLRELMYNSPCGVDWGLDLRPPVVHLETRPPVTKRVFLGHLIDISELGHTNLEIMYIPYLSFLVIRQGKLSLTYLLRNRYPGDNFPCRMIRKDIPGISFLELSMGYPWDNPVLPEISMICPIPCRRYQLSITMICTRDIYWRYLQSINDLSQGYLMLLSEADQRNAAGIESSFQKLSTA